MNNKSMQEKGNKQPSRTGEKNTLFLHLDGQSGTEIVTEEVDVMNITLKQVKVLWKSETISKTDSVLLVSIPGLGPSQMNNNIKSHPSCIPLMVNTSTICSVETPNISWSMNKKIPPKLRWRLLDVNGEDHKTTAVDYIELWFEYDLNPF